MAKTTSRNPKSLEAKRSYYAAIKKVNTTPTFSEEMIKFPESTESIGISDQPNKGEVRKPGVSDQIREYVTSHIVGTIFTVIFAVIGFFLGYFVYTGQVKDAELQKDTTYNHEQIIEIKANQQQQLEKVEENFNDEIDQQQLLISAIDQRIENVNNTITDINLAINELLLRIEFVEKLID